MSASSSPCCGCMQLGTGVLVIGVLESISGGISILSQIYFLSELKKGYSDAGDMYLKTLGLVTKEEGERALIVSLIIALCQLAAGIILIMGSVRRNATLCLVGMVVIIIATLAGSGFSIYLSTRNAMLILGIPLTIAYRAYFVWVIYAFKAELDRGEGENVDQALNPNFNNNPNYAQSRVPQYYSGNPTQNQAYLPYYSGNQTQNQAYPPYYSGNQTQNQAYSPTAPTPTNYYGNNAKPETAAVS